MAKSRAKPCTPTKHQSREAGKKRCPKGMRYNKNRARCIKPCGAGKRLSPRDLNPKLSSRLYKKSPCCISK